MGGLAIHLHGQTCELVRERIMDNRRFTVTELSSNFSQISRSFLHKIVAERLLFTKFCVGYVSKQLTPEHKTKRTESAMTFLQRYHNDGDEFLDRIIIGDEMWVAHIIPETKQQSMHWHHSGSPCKTKFKQTLSARKVMCTVFWDRRAIFLEDFLTRGEMVNAERYCETLQKLRWAVQNKRRGILSAGVVFLLDNAWPHTARRSKHLLQEFSWKMFNHLPYSLDLAPNDFHLFLHLKKFLSGQLHRFQNNRKEDMFATQWFQSQASDFYDTGIQIWSHGMTNISVPEVNMLNNSSTLAVSVPINLVL